MSRKIIIAIGAAGLILTAFNWTEAVARNRWVSHGSAGRHHTSSRDADHERNHANRDEDNRHKTQDHDGEWHKTSSGFHREWEAGGDTHSHESADRHHTSPRDADHDHERNHANRDEDNRHKTEDHDGEWHKTSSDFHRAVSYTHLTLPTKR